MGRQQGARGPVVPDGMIRAMHFAEWCVRMGCVPPVERVMAKFRVSRATAYRLMAAYRAACEAGR